MGVVNTINYKKGEDTEKTRLIPQLKPVRIKEISVLDVLSDNHVRFNTNNIWNDEGKPKDYDLIINSGGTKFWVDRFHFNKTLHKRDYFTFDIAPSDLRWMLQAERVGNVTGTFSSLYEKDLDLAVLNYSKNLDIPDGGNWFIRTELVSLKNGEFGAGPYHGRGDLARVFKSICSGTCGHSPIPSNKILEPLKLYFFPWIEFQKDLEFRGFVFENELTCLSVQHIYSSNHWCKTLHSKELLEKEIVKVIALFYKNIGCKLLDLKNYVVDMVLLENEELYFIETNCFGMEYAAGSALFEWKTDYDLMYGKADYFEFRYTF